MKMKIFLCIYRGVSKLFFDGTNGRSGILSKIASKTKTDNCPAFTGCKNFDLTSFMQALHISVKTSYFNVIKIN